MYFVGIALTFFGALLVNRIAGHRSRRSFFIMELPEYRLPSVKRAFISMCARGWAYIVKAGTIILVCNTVVQIMQTFTWSLRLAEAADASILASIARPFAWLLIPVIGVASWQMAAAAVTGFIAKENVVGTPPCFAALGAMNSEIGDRRWFWGGVALQFATGFTVSFLVYQIGTLITTGGFGAGFVPGLIAVAAIVACVIRLIRREKKRGAGCVGCPCSGTCSAGKCRGGTSCGGNTPRE